jgi:hypothetical protein
MAGESAAERVLNNPYDNVYWLSRLLISSDKSSGIGGNSELMLEVAETVRSVLGARANASEEELLADLSRLVRDVITSAKRPGTKVATALQSLCDSLDEKLVTLQDYEVLAFTCERILVPINNALARVPSNDSAFVASTAKALLEEKGEAGLSLIINLWDDIGTEGCLAAERIEVAKEFGLLSEYLDELLPEDSNEEKSIILSAFCQEFERRLAQKRKSRAGSSLESVTSFILKYFNIKTTDRPEHFTTGLEVDKWVRCKDGWIVGIGCKRTLRERWKQAYTTNIDELNRHKIRALWHVITYDNDLSDHKITEMGSHRAILFLPDDSPRYLRASKHPGMSGYVRPMSKFIKELKALL